MKRFILLVAIIAVIAMAFTACTKKSERTEGSTQSQTANPHPEILNEDLSAFAGIWASEQGEVSVLTSDGLFGGGYSAFNFRKDDDIYGWDVAMGQDSTTVWLYPVGIEVTGRRTDTSKVRISGMSNGIFYREGEISLPVPVDLKPGSFIDAYSEKDHMYWYAVTITEGNRLVVETDTWNVYLTAYNQNYKVIAKDDSLDDITADAPNPCITIIINNEREFGTYLFSAWSHNSSGNYRIMASNKAASQSKVWEPAELTGEWHSRSITGSCHGQEHYIFTADGYYRKGDLYQKHDGTWSLARDAATGKYHLTLQYKQFIDFESGWTPNDFTAYGEYETIDPNNIDLLLPGTGWTELTRCHNPGWSAQ
ncbi:MAG: hypothetical protein LBH16_02555 [Treponema sp.]|jgi:hypothetical protein|nr:hypothetical protein [Treponema sp.]